MEILVEVFRRVGSKARRAVVDQCFGMGETGFEREAVDERFQRRTGRADGGRHIDGALAASIHVSGRADLGEDFAGLVIGDDDGCRNLIADETCLFGRKFFEARLQRPIERQFDDVFFRMRRDLCFRQMRCEHREGIARFHDTFGLGSRGIGGGDDVRGDGAIENAIAGAARGFGVAIETALLGRLRQRDE